MAESDSGISGGTVPALKLSDNQTKMLSIVAKRAFNSEDQLRAILLKGARMADGTLVSFNEVQVDIILAEPEQYGIRYN